MILWLILAFIFAALEAVAVVKNAWGLEVVAKPAVMVFLFLWLYSSTGLQGYALWFGLGVLFSLAGDVLLMVPRERMFLLGLVAFLLAHIFYIMGFRHELATFNIWVMILLIFIAINVGRLLRRITEVLRTRQQSQLVLPVMVYGTVISVMLYASMLTIYSPDWKTSAALFVSVGAFLFCASDLVLAWNKFVSPVRNGRVWTMVLYHLGQIGLIAGVVAQFSAAGYA